MRYFLKIVKVQSVTDVVSGQEEVIKLEFKSEQQVLDSAKWFNDTFFPNQDTVVLLVIDRFAEGGKSSELEINLETLELL